MRGEATLFFLVFVYTPNFQDQPVGNLLLRRSAALRHEPFPAAVTVWPFSRNVSVDGLKLHKFVSAAPYGVLRAPPQPPAGSPGRKGSLVVRPAGLGYLLPHFGRPVARAVGGAFTARGCLKLHNLFP